MDDDLNKIFVFDFETTGLPPKDPKTRKRLDVNEETFHLFPRAVQISALLYNVKSKTVENTLNNIVLLDDGVEISEDAINVHGITKEMTKEKGIACKFLLDTFFKMLESANTVIAHNIAFDVDILKTEVFHFFTDGDKKNRNKLLRIIAKKIETGYCTMEKTTNLCKLRFDTTILPDPDTSLLPSATLLPSTSLLPLATLTPEPTSLLPSATLTPDPGTSLLPAESLLPDETFKGFKKIYKWPKLTELHFILFGYIPENLHDAKTDCLVCLKCYLFITSSSNTNLQSEFALLGI
jgi:DNA polymerase III epsilon subunit-like protein